MVNSARIAIADTLKHPKLGIISHQPDLKKKIEDKIRVKDRNCKIHYVLASECEWASEEERNEYWSDFHEKLRTTSCTHPNARGCAEDDKLYCPDCETEFAR